MASLSGRSLTAGAVLLALLLLPPPSRALEDGIDSTVFGATGCPLCHFGGTVPSVVLAGPDTVIPGNTYEYTLTITGNLLQTHGGLNVAASDGVLSLGGVLAANTQTVVGAGGRDEITHTAPKAGDAGNVIEFSFQWTAPVSFTSETLSAWGNAVNFMGSPAGDNAAFASLEIMPDGLVPCGDTTAPDPVLTTNDAEQRCQATVGKAGFLYLKQHVKAAQRCLKSFQSGELAGDPLDLCVGSASVPPTDGTTAGKLAKAEAKLRALLSADCPSAVVAPLDMCADTQSGLGDCLLQTHRQRALDAIVAQYGALAPLGDAALAKCQSALAGAALKYISAHQRASQKCLDTRNKNGAPLLGANTLCSGELTGGIATAPTDEKAAQKVAKAITKLTDKITDSCTDSQVAALGACGTTRAQLIQCLMCAHTTTVFEAIADEYGGD